MMVGGGGGGDSGGGDSGIEKLGGNFCQGGKKRTTP